MFTALRSSLLSPMMIVIQSYIICRDKYAKSLDYVLNQNVNVTKRERFATLAMRIVDNASGGGGGGVFSMIPCTGRLLAKRVSFSAFRYVKG